MATGTGMSKNAAGFVPITKNVAKFIDNINTKSIIF